MKPSLKPNENIQEPVNKSLVVFDNLEIVFLMGIWRSGTHYLMSLFDSHPQVLLIPAGVKVYRIYHFTKHLPIEKTLEYLTERTLSNIFQNKKSMEDGDFRNYNISIETFRDEFINIWKSVPSNAKNFLYTLHYSYALSTGQSVTVKKMLFVHIHTYGEIPQYLSDYPTSKWIFLVRDPTSGFYSNFVKYRKFLGGSCGYDNAWLTPFIIWKNSKSTLILERLNKDRFLKIKIEDLTLDLRGVMRNIVSKLSIDFNPSLLSPTLGGVPYVSTSPLNKKVKGSYRGIMKKTYNEELSKYDILFLETLLKNEFQRFGYNLETSANMSKNEMLKLKFCKKNWYERFIFRVNAWETSGNRTEYEEALMNECVMPVEKYKLFRLLNLLRLNWVSKIILSVWFMAKSMGPVREKKQTVKRLIYEVFKTEG